METVSKTGDTLPATLLPGEGVPIEGICYGDVENYKLLVNKRIICII